MPIGVIDKIKPLGEHYIADACDIDYKEEKTVEKAIDDINSKMRREPVHVNINAEDWKTTNVDADIPPYKATYQIDDIRESDQITNAILVRQPVQTSIAEENAKRIAFNNIVYAETTDGSITFTALFAKPAVNIEVLLMF